MLWSLSLYAVFQGLLHEPITESFPVVNSFYNLDGILGRVLFSHSLD